MVMAVFKGIYLIVDDKMIYFFSKGANYDMKRLYGRQQVIFKHRVDRAVPRTEILDSHLGTNSSSVIYL